MTHSGSDGSRMSDRIEKYGSWDGHIAENIAYGESGDEYMLCLYVDDGDKDKRSRKTIMNPHLMFTGIARCEHTT